MRAGLFRAVELLLEDNVVVVYLLVVRRVRRGAGPGVLRHAADAAPGAAEIVMPIVEPLAV